jgi:hypothetical protein
MPNYSKSLELRTRGLSAHIAPKNSAVTLALALMCRSFIYEGEQRDDRRGECKVSKYGDSFDEDNDTECDAAETFESVWANNATVKVMKIIGRLWPGFSFEDWKEGEWQSFPLAIDAAEWTLVA